MKLVNGKAEFESVTCWECEGSLQVKRYKLCPNNNKSTHRKPCQFCGQVVRRFGSHPTVGDYMKACPTCEGKGQKMETECDRPRNGDLEPVIASLTWVLNPPKVTTAEKEFIIATYSGRQTFGVMDYKDHRTDTLEMLKPHILEDLRGSHQYCHFLDKEMRPLTTIKVYGYNGGYSAYLTSEIKLKEVA